LQPLPEDDADGVAALRSVPGVFAVGAAEDEGGMTPFERLYLGALTVLVGVALRHWSGWLVGFAGFGWVLAAAGDTWKGAHRDQQPGRRKW
jgi:hypothetical protein